MSSTLAETDNETVAGFSNNTMKQSKSKTLNVHFHWTWDHIKNEDFTLFWGVSANKNLTNSPTKDHPRWHHNVIHSHFVKPRIADQTKDTIAKQRPLREAVKPLPGARTHKAHKVRNTNPLGLAT